MVSWGAGCNEPPFANPLDDSGLDFSGSRNGTMIAQPHFAHILNVERLVTGFVLPQLAAVTIGVFDAVKTGAAFETRKPWLLTCSQAAKESRKGLIQTAQQVLPAGCVDLTKCVSVLPAFSRRTSRKYTHCPPEPIP